MIIESRLVTAVSEIDRGVLPLAIRVRTLLVTPPGHKDKMIRPIENSGESFMVSASPKAMRGSKITWFNKPTAKAFGNFKIRVKSLFLSPSPSENMINAKTSGSAIWIIMTRLMKRWD